MYVRWYEFNLMEEGGLLKAAICNIDYMAVRLHAQA